MHPIQAIFRTLTLALTFSLLATASQAASRISPMQTEIDFGVIFQGEKVERTFTFRNDGDEPLKIDQVRSSCGCTAALLSAEVIPPGESGEVTATFDSTRFHGPVKKTIYLYSNDPGRQVTQLHLKGDVRELVLLEPHRLSVGPIPAETPSTYTVSLTNQGRNPLRLGSIRSSVQEISATVQPEVLKPEETGTLTVVVTPRKGSPRINAYIMVGTDSTVLPQLRLPIHVQVAEKK